MGIGIQCGRHAAIWTSLRASYKASQGGHHSDASVHNDYHNGYYHNACNTSCTTYDYPAISADSADSGASCSLSGTDYHYNYGACYNPESGDSDGSFGANYYGPAKTARTARTPECRYFYHDDGIV